MKTLPRVCVVSDNLGPTLDEGTRKFAASLIRGLAAHADVRGLAVGAGTGAGSNGSVISVPTNRLFLSLRLRRQVAGLSPDLICYVPSASGTLFSFIRARALKSFYPRARVAMVALQGRSHGPLGKRLIYHLRPDAVFVQSPETMQELASLGCQPFFLPSGVDLDRFRPAPPGEKARLRAKYGLPGEAFLVLHVGHLKAERNVQALTRPAPGAVGVMLSARSMGQEEGLRRHLEARGVIVIDRYVEEVQEVYQACDCYLFPVRDIDSAIDIPLTVLEAMACNLPVISYPFGGLPHLFEPGDGLWFVETEEQIVRALDEARALGRCRTRQMVEPHSWQNVAARLLAAMKGTDDVEERVDAPVA